MVESIIEGLDRYFRDCPLLQDGVFRVDALGDEAVEYMLEPGISSPVVKTYVDGSSVRQYLFNFNSREYYGMDRVQAIQNSTFYEKFGEWVEEQSEAGRLPELPEGMEARSISVLTPGYLYDASFTSARYQIQLQLKYYKEA